MFKSTDCPILDSLSRFAKDLTMNDNTSRIVIVGAGVFGLTAALELSKRGYRSIVVFDRHEPPVYLAPLISFVFQKLT